MTSSLPTNTYPDADYEKAHQTTFSSPRPRPIKATLPPGVSQAKFDESLNELASVVGKDAVFVKEALAHYIDPYDIHESDESKRKVPSAAVCPSSLDELRQVIRVANKFDLPLWTFSRGKNLGYGGPAPRVNGSVALDLHRMNKILEVNEEFAYAVVEPGVTFNDLYNYCVNNNKKVWPSTPSLGWGSVVGNTLDRGTGFGLNSNHHQCIAGLEVVLGDGDVVRTGQFGISNSPSAFLSKFTYGPSVEGLFLQSNLGVVTKLSIWLAPQPPAFISGFVTVPEDEDIEAMVDVLGEMRRNGLIPNVVWITNFVEWLCIRGKRSDFWKGDGPIPDWRLKEVQKEFGVGWWTAKFGLYGPKRVIEAQLAEIEHQLKEKLPVGKLTGKLYAGENGQLLDAKSVPPEDGLMLVGVPSLFSLPLMDWPIKRPQGKAAHGDYAPVIPASGRHIADWMRASKAAYAANGIDLMADFFMHERHIIFCNMFTYDQQDAEECNRIEQLYMSMYEEAKTRGYGMYRAHVNHMDLIAELNDFNDHAYNRFTEKIKDALDPNGVLSPGKSGIWPQKHRHLRETTEKTPRQSKI